MACAHGVWKTAGEQVFVELVAVFCDVWYGWCNIAEKTDSFITE